ncbi:MAG: tRNA 2-selenouridine(34) synthase MnmH [Pseudomonadota bacterium]
MQLNTSNNYADIFLSNSDLLDVRAPIEFKQGAFPNAANLPLLNDDERSRIGICYKKQGQEKAIELGHKIVSGNTRQKRLEQWINYAREHQNSYLYCLRGGLRSKIAQQWLAEAEIEITRVEGGYKALRNFLIKHIESADRDYSFTLVGGMTGCQKTKLVRTIENGIDLEGAAYHRGSSFGAHALPQSSQINFENVLAIDLLKAEQLKLKSLVLEDEGRFIGSVDIPKNIYNKMRTSSIVVVERSLEERIQQLLQEYVIDMKAEFYDAHQNQDQAFQSFSEYLLSSLNRIKKRLGQQKWSELNSKMETALSIQHATDDIFSHQSWLEPLLTDYYDPMYTSQLKNREELIVFQGSYTECQQFLNEHV